MTDHIHDATGQYQADQALTSISHRLETEQAIPAGYNQSEVGLIPKDWLAVPLGEVMKIKHGKSQREIEIDDGIYPIWATGGEIGRTNTPIYSKPSVLIGRKGTIDKPRYSESPFWSVDTLFYSEINSNTDPKFLFYKLCMVDWLSYNEASGVPSLNASTIEAIFSAIPKLTTEQTAIATALSDVDALLGSLAALMAKKQAIKTATMQQLLTGKTRLPQFATYPDGTPKGMQYTELGDIPEDWEVKSVRDVIIDYFCGPSPTCLERNIYDNEWGVLKTTAATVGSGWDWRKHKLLPKMFWHKYNIELREGDVIVTKAGPRHRVGIAVTINYIPRHIMPSGKMIALRPDLIKVNPQMLSLAIMGKHSQGFLNQRTTGMAEAQLNYENMDLLDAPIILQSFKEQLAITKVITDMDTEIQTLERQLNKTRQIKQGMMQELLTGRTRLPY